jgi:hypothetical protein
MEDKMEPLIKGYFSIDGSTEPDNVFEGYTDGNIWNGWACVAFTREQMETYCRSMPYDHRFTLLPEKGVLIYTEDEIFIDASVATIEDDLVEVYWMESYCFVEMKKIGENQYALKE